MFSRYKPSFIVGIVYMLQASEYILHDYFEWLHRTSDFSNVMVRKKIVYTTKARLLLAAIIFCYIFIAMVGYISFNIAGLGLGIILAPWVSPYLVVIPIWLGNFLIQRPQQARMDIATKSRLKEINAQRIAIVGSYGKTSFKEILLSILEEGFKVAATPGNNNTPIGIARFVNNLSGSEEVLIFELGEYYPGDIRKLSKLVSPDLGIITGINEAHLSRMKSVENTINTIFEISEFLEPSRIYINGESKHALSRSDSNNKMYSKEGVGELIVDRKSINPGIEGLNFKLSIKKQHYALKSTLLGEHNVGPICAAVSIAHDLGLTKKEIEEGVSKIEPAPHRMQLRKTAGVYEIDDSYNGNPDGAKAAIHFLMSLEGVRKIYVTPGFVEMGHKAREVHEQLGALLAESGIDIVVLVKNSASPYIRTGLQDNGFRGELFEYNNSLDALSSVRHLTRSGDVVLHQNDWPDNYK